MATLVSCQTETKLCTLCGRGPVQTTFCSTVAQSAGTSTYTQNAVEERTGGPHIA